MHKYMRIVVGRTADGNRWMNKFYNFVLWLLRLVCLCSFLLGDRFMLFTILLVLAVLQAPSAQCALEYHLYAFTAATAAAFALKLCNERILCRSNSNDEAQHGAWCILYLSTYIVQATGGFFLFSRAIKKKTERWICNWKWTWKRSNIFFLKKGKR